MGGGHFQLRGNRTQGKYVERFTSKITVPGKKLRHGKRRRENSVSLCQSRTKSAGTTMWRNSTNLQDELGGGTDKRGQKKVEETNVVRPRPWMKSGKCCGGSTHQIKLDLTKVNGGGKYKRGGHTINFPLEGEKISNEKLSSGNYPRGPEGGKKNETRPSPKIIKDWK